MEYMATLPDKAFDLTIVDPPYGIGNFLMDSGGGKVKYDGKRNYKGSKFNWNNSTPDKNYFDELERVSKKKIIWGANYYNCFDSKGGALIWYKNMGHKSLSQCEIASLSFQKKVDYFAFKQLNGFLCTDPRIHPCQKPIELYDFLLTNYAKPGQRILDTHLGSGSSAIAAHYFGCDFVGCELDKDYYDAAVNRFNLATAQVSLFEEI
jgi:site-specific DNA-methyltransferase (adenine-specific)